MADSREKTLEELKNLRNEVKRLRTTLNKLTPGLEILLKRRGFVIYKQAPVDDLFIPAKRHINGFYRMLRKYSFRLFLRDVIRNRDHLSIESVARYATREVTGRYLDYLVSLKLVRKKGSEYSVTRPARSFGETLEWYIAEVLRREFGCEAVWGVKFRRPRVGGDYDVIAKFDGSLLYAEVKSSPPKQIYDSEISAFLDRVADFSPEIAVFFMDTELRMKDKIVPMFEKELAGRHDPGPEVERMERELFHVKDRIFIINAREDIIQNMQAVFSWYYRKK